MQISSPVTMVAQGIEALLASHHAFPEHVEIFPAENSNPMYGHYKARLGGAWAMVKTSPSWKRPLWRKILAGANGLVSPYFMAKHPVLKVRRKSYHPFSKEMRTVEAWRKLGFTVPQLLFYSDTVIAYEFMDGISYDKILARPGMKTEFEKLLDLYHRIRAAAFRDSNPDLFHSDPHLDNFLYERPRGIAIAIDPAVELTALPMAEVDARLNMDFCYSVMSLNTSRETIRGYLSMFASTLAPAEAREMLKVHKRIPSHAVAYFVLREEIASRISHRPKVNPQTFENFFVRENHQLLEDALLAVA